VKRILTLMLVICMLLPAALAEAVQYPLLVKDADAQAVSYHTVAYIAETEGYALMDGISPNSNGPEPEYYFAPADAESPVRFIYYTTGYGDCSALAEAAVKSYGAFYDDFAAGEITETTIAGKPCLTFSYTCSYRAQNGYTPVYEQSALCYFPVSEGTFIACILSLSFDSAEEYLDAEALNALVEQAAAAIQMAE